MASKYFLHLSYRGTAYRGWQKQPGVDSVQERLEQALSQVLKEEIVVTACGRTDAGVHARQFFVHVLIERDWDFDLIYRVNKALPDDISVYEIVAVGEKAHARYDATERAYDFFIHSESDAFLNPLSTLVELELDKLDVSSMAAAAKLLIGEHDFVQLCKKPDVHNTTVCTVSSSELFISEDQRQLRFHIRANRFLMGMIRIIMRQLLDIAEGKQSIEQFAALINGQPTKGSKILAYPQGLYLSEVCYPYIEIAPRNQMGFLFQEAQSWQLID